MKKSFIYNDYCLNCGSEHSGGFFTLLFLGDIFSWNCPHCGSLVRINYFLYIIYQIFGLMIALMIIAPLLKWTNIEEHIVGLVFIIIVLSIGGLLPYFATPRKLVKKPNEI